MATNPPAWRVGFVTKGGVRWGGCRPLDWENAESGFRKLISATRETLWLKQNKHCMNWHIYGMARNTIVWVRIWRHKWVRYRITIGMVHQQLLQQQMWKIMATSPQNMPNGQQGCVFKARYFTAGMVRSKKRTRPTILPGWCARFQSAPSLFLEVREPK